MPASEMQRRFAMQLLAGQQQPVGPFYTPAQGIADAGSKILGAILTKRADAQDQTDRSAYQQTIARALAGPQAPADGVGPLPDRNEFLIRELAGNEQTAPLALEYALKHRLGSTELPSDIQSFNEVKKMTPQDRELFFQTKRGAQIKEVGGVPSVISGREVVPLSTLQREAEAGATKEGAKTTAKESAEVRVAAGADLPRIEGNAEQTLKLLEKLEKSDLGLIYGAAALVPIIPGTPQADVYSDWKQLQGKAFLEAFNSLKGGGQITEAEGQKATAAITSLEERKQRPESAKKAIADLREVIKAGVQRARKKAGAAAGGELTPEEQAELEALRKRFGR